MKQWLRRHGSSNCRSLREERTLRLTDSPWRFISDLYSKERRIKMLLILSNVYLSNEGIYRIVYGGLPDSSNSNICQYYDCLCTEPREYDRRSQYDRECK